MSYPATAHGKDQDPTKNNKGKDNDPPKPDPATPRTPNRPPWQCLHTRDPHGAAFGRAVCGWWNMPDDNKCHSCGREKFCIDLSQDAGFLQTWDSHDLHKRTQWWRDQNKRQ